MPPWFGCATRRDGRWAIAASWSHAAARHRRAEIDAGEPEAALGLDAGHVGVDARARLREQREHVDLHRVVTKQRLVRDDLAQRQHLVAVVPGDLISGAVAAIGVA